MLNKDELLFVVDENNTPLEPKPRKEVHEKGYWHRTSHIWILNSQKQILCQRRSLLKDSNPGKWEPFFGGHLETREEYENNALHELQEELGIIINKDNLHLFKIFKCVPATEFQGIHYLEWNGDIETLKLEKDEIDQVKWFSIDELYKILIDKKDSNWSIMGYEKELLEYFNGLV